MTQFIRPSLRAVLVTVAAGLAAAAVYGYSLACAGCSSSRAASSASSESIAPPVGCKLGALSAEERAAHDADGRALLRLSKGARPLLDGWELKLPASAAAAVIHWYGEERRCCPFITFEMSVPAGAEELEVRLRGDGVKELLRPWLTAAIGG